MFAAHGAVDALPKVARRLELAHARLELFDSVGIVARYGAVFLGRVGASVERVGFLDRFEPLSVIRFDAPAVAPIAPLGMVAHEDRLAERDDARHLIRRLDAPLALGAEARGARSQPLEARVSFRLEREPCSCALGRLVDALDYCFMG